VVLPGIAAGVLAPHLAKPDQAYPYLMTLLPTGLLGLVFAALIAAIVASMGSKINSIATIFTIDLYKPFHKNASERMLVIVGRITAVVALAAALLTAKPLLGNLPQAFQYIQEYTGFVTPGIVVIFILGLFWSRATTAGAFVAAIGSVALSVAYKVYAPEIPFMNRVGYVFLICLGAAIAVSLAQRKTPASTIDVSNIDYSTSLSFNVASVFVVIILTMLYTAFW
jgi:solute:Na+ symporter, SSS family